MLYKLSQRGYILRERNVIEVLTYSEYLREFGADETTTGKGVAPRLYIDGTNIYTWGVRGNNHKLFLSCKNKREAKNALFEIWENNVSNDWNAPRFFTKKIDLFEYVSECNNKGIDVVKRYFRLKYVIERKRLQESILVKEKFENAKKISKGEIENFIVQNSELIKQSLIELDELKKWHKENYSMAYEIEKFNL